MTKEQYEQHYRDLIQTYFSDTTDEGRIVKYAEMREAEWTLVNVFGYSGHHARSIYEEEYWKKYAKGDEK